LQNELIGRLRKLEEILEHVEKKFTDIYISAINTVKGKNVKKYIFRPSNKVLWVVVGKEREYIITEWKKSNNLFFVCSCPDFLFHVLLKSTREKALRRNVCYHTVARIICEIHEIRKKLGMSYSERFLPELLEEKDDYYVDFLREILEVVD